MSELILLKLGGSVITDKNRPFTARHDVIQRLGREIKQALDTRTDLRLIVGHGSGSFGHMVAHKYRTREGVIDERSWQGYAETGMAAARLNRIVADLLAEEGVPLVSFQPSAMALCQGGHLTHFEMRPIKRVLEAGLVPLVYGDVAIDADRGFTIISTEQIFEYMTPQLGPSRVVLAGIVDGVYEADPLTHRDARLYRHITANNWREVQAALGGSHATDVTGGMLSKVRGMVQLAQSQPGLAIHIVSGEIPGRVASILCGQPQDTGTLISHTGIDD